jgi:hypothetical protein
MICSLFVIGTGAKKGKVDLAIFMIYLELDDCWKFKRILFVRLVGGI